MELAHIDIVQICAVILGKLLSRSSLHCSPRPRPSSFMHRGGAMVCGRNRHSDTLQQT